MKKVIFAMLMLSLFAVPSCKKSSSPSSAVAYGWSFKGVSYIPSGSSGSAGYITAEEVSPNVGSMIIVFGNAALPTTAGTDTVVGYGPGTRNTQVYVDVTAMNWGEYSSTGGNGRQTVQIGMSSGNVTVKGTNIEMVNQMDPTDSAPLTFYVIQ